jgi:hypothetical protein
MGDYLYHDWQKIVIELLAAKLSQAYLAKKCQCSPAYIHKIKEGGLKGDPGTGIGVTLLNLHRYHCRIKKG